MPGPIAVTLLSVHWYGKAWPPPLSSQLMMALPAPLLLLAAALAVAMASRSSSLGGAPIGAVGHSALQRADRQGGAVQCALSYSYLARGPDLARIYIGPIAET